MKLIVLCIIFIGLSSTQGNIPDKPDEFTCNCGWITSESGKITYPWLVEIVNRVGENHLCIGTILTQWHVIATASCLKTFRPEDILVCLTGKGNKCDIEDLRMHVKRITFKKRFVEVSGMNDLSMIHTENKIEFHKYVGPVCFPHKKFSHNWLYYWQPDLMFLGFEDQKDVKTITFKTWEEHKCTTRFTFRGDRHICLVNNKDSQQNVQGDSGALFMLIKGTDRYTLVGIFLVPSLIINKKQPTPYSSVVTNFTVYRGWADDIVFGKKNARLCNKE